MVYEIQEIGLCLDSRVRRFPRSSQFCCQLATPFFRPGKGVFQWISFSRIG